MKITCFVLFTTIILGCAAGSKKTEATEASKDPQRDKPAETQQAAVEAVPTIKPKASGAMAEIKAVLREYTRASAVHSKIKKEVKLELLGEEKTSSGQIFFSNGHVRIEIDKPDESLIVLSPDTIWVVIPADKDLGSKTQVTKIISKSLQQQSRAPLALLLTNEKSWDQFKVIRSSSKNKKNSTADLVPKDKNALGEVTKIQVHYNPSQKQIIKISYWDDLDNQTTFHFMSTTFNAKIKKDLFNYKPAKDAEVTVFE